KRWNGRLSSGMWVPDGPVAGTSELAATYIGPGDLTVFGSKALFSGDAPGIIPGTGGPLALWVTDGTQAGTSELVQFAGAFGPANLTFFGNEALFSAPGSNTTFAHNHLSSTYGPSAGTT